MPKPRRKKQIKETVHDRRAIDMLANARSIPMEIYDPYSIKRADTFGPGVRKDGTIAPAGGEYRAAEDDRIIVLASRDDILRRLHASKGIDDAQFAAGRAWEADWQKAGVGHTSSGGQWRERVQGGGVSQEDLTDKKKNAIDRLGDADRALGIQGCAIVRSFLGDRMNTSGVAIRFMGNSSQRSIDYVNRRFRECLETLVVVYQLGSVK